MLLGLPNPRQIGKVASPLHKLGGFKPSESGPSLPKALTVAAFRGHNNRSGAPAPRREL